MKNYIVMIKEGVLDLSFNECVLYASRLAYDNNLQESNIKSYKLFILSFPTLTEPN